MNEIQQFVELMAQSISHMNITDREKEIVKAGLRFAINYANQSYREDQIKEVL